jgi:hypothetical protein
MCCWCGEKQKRPLPILGTAVLNVLSNRIKGIEMPKGQKVLIKKLKIVLWLSRVFAGVKVLIKKSVIGFCETIVKNSFSFLSSSLREHL